MSDTNDVTQPAADRWISLRTAAGYASDRALERAANLTQGTIASWTTSNGYRRQPMVDSYRVLSRLLKIPLDRLDELILALRQEKQDKEVAVR